MENPCAVPGGPEIQLPAETQIEGQFLRDLPLIAAEGEDPPLAVPREVGVDVAADGAGHIEQEAGHLVADIGGNAAPVAGGGRLRESDGAARAVGLVLQQVVVNAPHVHAELDGVVADDLGPMVYRIDVGLAATQGSDAE